MKKKIKQKENRSCFVTRSFVKRKKNHKDTWHGQTKIEGSKKTAYRKHFEINLQPTFSLWDDWKYGNPITNCVSNDIFDKLTHSSQNAYVSARPTYFHIYFLSTLHSLLHNFHFVHGAFCFVLPFVHIVCTDSSSVNQLRISDSSFSTSCSTWSRSNL